MRDEVINILKQKTETKELQDLRQRVKGLVKMSRSVMKDYYPLWDKNDSIYRGERAIDETDRKAIKRAEPAKVFVPLSHSQCQTFAAFGTMVLTQRDWFYEIGGTGIEDERSAKLMQAVIQRDLVYNKFKGILLPQFLIDVARYGVGIFKSQWRNVTMPVAVQVPDPKWKPQANALPGQAQAPTITQWQDKTKYQGNMLEVVSPYRWFPDTRLPLTRYREGEFCADEREYSFQELEKLQSSGVVAGIDDIPRLPDNSDAFNERRLINLRENNNVGYTPSLASADSAFFCVVSEVELRCNPSKLKIGDGVVLDPDLDADVIVLIWVANDGRIIRIEDSGYDHSEFLFDAAQFFNDQTRVINHGISELIGPMQDIMDWLMNSRVTNVRKIMQNQLVVDPRFVEMQDLKDRNPIVRLKSTVEGMAISNFLTQLNVHDVTQSHVSDMANVQNFAEDATGMTENLLGSYSSGRRSAREASNVNANAAARVMLPLNGLWDGALYPLGQKLQSNIQQGLDIPQLVNIVGLQRVVLEQDAVQQFLPVDRSMLQGSYHFLTFDATLPSQRMAVASTLQEVLVELSQNPRLVFALGYDPKLIFEEWLELSGVRNAERFRLTPQRIAELVQLAATGGVPGGPQVPGQPAQVSGPNGPSQSPNVQGHPPTGGSTGGAFARRAPGGNPPQPVHR